MSKSKFGNTNLYMTTREFADLVIDTLNDQNYFKHGDTAHPQDIAHAFTTVAETIGNAMAWAIKQEADYRKETVLKVGDLKKSGATLPMDEEIAPNIGYSEFGYGEWKHSKNA